MQFPDRYETLVGEKGVKLSGGQKQRLAIARALIMEPKILVFDEATSALDMITENNIQKSIRENIIAKQNLTVIQIAHRLSTIKDSDVIFMLKDGEIVERGKYEDLIKNKGDFFELVQIQTQEAAVKKRKKNLEKEIEKLDEKLDENKQEGMKKLDTMIKTMSVKQDFDGEKAIKIAKIKSKKAEANATSKLKMKHLSSMSENWKQLKTKIELGMRMQRVNKDIQKEKGNGKGNDGDELTLTEAQELIR